MVFATVPTVCTAPTTPPTAAPTAVAADRSKFFPDCAAQRAANACRVLLLTIPLTEGQAMLAMQGGMTYTYDQVRLAGPSSAQLQLQYECKDPSVHHQKTVAIG